MRLLGHSHLLRFTDPTMNLFRSPLFIWGIASIGLAANLWAEETKTRFTTVVLSEVFHSEGASVADLNRDGASDVVSGPYWYEGPDFRTKHAYANVTTPTIKAYSDHFFSFASDLDQDGWVDLVAIPIPGEDVYWYRNPGQNKSKIDKSTTGSEAWERFPLLTGVGNESPTLADVDGDEIPDLVCVHQGRLGYARQQDDPRSPWRFIPVSDREGYGRFTHGLGIGDLNGDGKVDILETNGWWEQSERSAATFSFHPVQFAESGGAQMLVVDIDGDGDHDVVSSQNAHAYGLAWFEHRIGPVGDHFFVKHQVMGNDASQQVDGLAISQLHALAAADIDGDGVSDIVTGKRFWAHGGNDPGAQELPVLYWFRTARSKHGVTFEPNLISRRVGVGTQVTVADVDGNNHLDVVVGNKLGTFVAFNRGAQEASANPVEPQAVLPGTAEFRSGVRTTDPLSPEEEQKTFVLPPGFEAELVVSEPQIAKPMNLAFDHRHRLWISSSSEYPFPADEGQGRDTIKVLEDSNGDGNYDNVTTFADGLNIPIGLYPYGNGVICFSIPNIWYLQDTDGDGKADRRDVLYGPFDTSRDTHGMCNAFTRGYDGWLYACHGFNNQSSVTGGDGNTVTMHSGNTFRMRLDGSRIEHFTHGQVNPFGLAFDHEGNAFTADCHTKPVTLLLRGGYYPSFGKPHDGLGFVPPVMEHLNGSTAIGGMALYEGDQFPETYRRSAFGGNVMTSRINRNSIVDRGGSIEAVEQSDFLISGDPWFRPVDLQVGPDGALYVADFYNRIIGHYEVPLNHPGRDRHRGRVWRIKYTGKNRRDHAIVSAPSYATPLTNRANVSIDEQIHQQIERLNDSNLANRMLAADVLADRIGTQAIPMIRQTLQQQTSSNSIIHTLWILYRLQDLRSDDLTIALKSNDVTVRIHGFRVLGEQNAVDGSDWILQGLTDRDVKVKRAAASAATQHPSIDYVQPLLNLLKTTDGDPHLHHVVRMALRDHLIDQELFQLATKTLTAAQLPIVLDLCLAIRTDFAGQFVAKHIDRIASKPPTQLAEFLQFASRYGDNSDLQAVINLARETFAQNLAVQETLLRSVKNGRAQRGETMPKAVQSWATDLACGYLGIESPDAGLPEFVASIGWKYIPSPRQIDQPNPWTVSTKRRSADGEQASKLWSSFPRGESLTGTFRSSAFELPADFQFFIAGHDGFPGKPIQNNNFVQIRDATTREILKRWSPPRNDVAQHVRWDTGDQSGRSVIIELIDQDSASAYAWLAVGRFSLSSLNPSDSFESQRKATDLIAEFRLDGLKPIVKQLFELSDASPQQVAAYAKAWTALAPSATKDGLAESFNVGGLTHPIQERLVVALIDGTQVAEALQETMQVATSIEQSKIAEKLASDSQGAQFLLDLVTQGRASANLLTTPAIAPKLQQVASADQQQQLHQLTKDLAAEAPELSAQIHLQREHYASRGGDRLKGAALFKIHCAVCHQVAGQGAEVGPNLDGLGARGLDRVVEDVLAPNRNVDAAFRTSVILLDDGRVLSGLVKRSEGAQLIVVDEKGKEIAISKDSIETQKQNQNSPMPANFHELLSPQQRSDLLAYLLSLTS